MLIQYAMQVQYNARTWTGHDSVEPVSLSFPFFFNAVWIWKREQGKAWTDILRINPFNIWSEEEWRQSANSYTIFFFFKHEASSHGNCLRVVSDCPLTALWGRMRTKCSYTKVNRAVIRCNCVREVSNSILKAFLSNQERRQNIKRSNIKNKE